MTRTRGLLAPHVLSAFRKTRSGMGFSPWTRDREVGSPLHAPDFDLEIALRALASQAGPPQATGTSSSSEASTGQRSSAASPDDPDDPDLGNASTTTRFCEGLMDNEELDGYKQAQLEDLFKSFSRTGDTTRKGLQFVTSTSPKCIPPAPPVFAHPTAHPETVHTTPVTRPMGPHATSSSGEGADVSKRKARASLRSKELRRRRRAGDSAKEGLLPHQLGKPAKACALRQIHNALAMYADLDFSQLLAEDNTAVNVACDSEPLETDYSLDQEDVPVTSSAYTARFLKQTAAELRPITKEEALRLGFQYVPWSGRVTRAVLDRRRRVVVLLDGRPNDPTWDQAVNGEMSRLIPLVAGAYHFDPRRKPNRRGDFETISCGISFGGGQKRVGNFALSTHNRAIWSLLLKLQALRRVANFANTSMKVFFPRLHAYYTRTLASLCAHDPNLRRNFDDNSFAAISINLGPRAVSYPHTDHLNLAHGLCAITALGNYDPVKGGHLILWDLRMIIEFPPGSTILLPSAIIKHSNTALASNDERRYAFLQYSAGGLFRWVDCGFQSKKSFVAAGNKFEMTGEERWKEGTAMYSTWEELQGRATN